MKNQGWIAFDQWLNALFFGGWADETLSARAWRNAAQGHRKWIFLVKVFNGFFFWQKNHCRGAYAMEINRLHMPPTYRAVYDKAVADEAAV